MTDPARLKLVIHPHSGECGYNLIGSGYAGLEIGKLIHKKEEAKKTKRLPTEGR